MRTKIAVFAFSLLLYGCKETTKPVSVIRTILESQEIDRSKNVLIYTINPNDCLNCLIGFTSINDQLSKVPNSKIILISVEREIEKQKLSKSITSIDLNPSKNKIIIWDKKKAEELNLASGLGPGLSSVIVYNYQKDSILFAKPAREIQEISTLKKLL